MKAACDETTFIQLWKETGGSAVAVARKLGISERNVHGRRNRIEAKGVPMPSNDVRSTRPRSLPPGRMVVEMPDCTVLVGSDAHVWPGELTTAQRGFIHLAKTLKPDIVVLNGDVFDGARISRHPAGIWSQQQRPNVRQELEACQAFMDAVAKAHNPAKKFWTWGNHDGRFEMRCAALVPEYEGVPGFALKDHFPEWTMGMSLWVNDCVIKHRANHSGVHAIYNNTLKAGKSIVTGHLHALRVHCYTDYNGDRYGVDTGTLADPWGPQFDYQEDNSRSHRAGMAILTFRDGKLLLPELAQVWDEDTIQFRGQLIRV
jgi:predicted MPP superfamily phosphohydrolase